MLLVKLVRRVKVAIVMIDQEGARAPAHRRYGQRVLAGRGSEPQPTPYGLVTEEFLADGGGATARNSEAILL